MDELKYLLWLDKIFGSSNRELWNVLSRHHTSHEAYYAIKDGDYEGMTKSEIEKAQLVDVAYCEDIIAYCKKNEFNIISYKDDDYPRNLNRLIDKPPVLFCMGNPGFLNDSVTVTIVGARRPSEYSVRVANKICSDLASLGIVLISGFAMGIDSRAHAAALRNKVPTVAVLGSGLDIDYPKENTKFKRVIAQKGGAVISEFFPGTKPNAVNFPIRNRIMAALGIGTVVVEASETSGSLKTVGHALDMGRDVFAVAPADIFDPRYKGNIDLINDGAEVVLGYGDILKVFLDSYEREIILTNSKIKLDIDNSKSYKKNELKTKELKLNEFVYENQKENSDETETKANKIENNIDYSKLDELQTIIVEELKSGDKSINELTDILSSSYLTSDIIISLTELEMNGYVQLIQGTKYSL